MNDKVQKQILKHVDELLDQNSRNIARELKRRALLETCDYVEKHMLLTCSRFENRYELLDYALEKISVKNGLWLEFGVYQGNTINYIAGKTNSLVYGFDFLRATQMIGGVNTEKGHSR